MVLGGTSYVATATTRRNSHTPNDRYVVNIGASTNMVNPSLVRIFFATVVDGANLQATINSYGNISSVL